MQVQSSTHLMQRRCKVRNQLRQIFNLLAQRPGPLGRSELGQRLIFNVQTALVASLGQNLHYPGIINISLVNWRHILTILPAQRTALLPIAQRVVYILTMYVASARRKLLDQFIDSA